MEVRNRTLEICAVVIACLALIGTWRSECARQEHDKLSVKPRVRTYASADYRDGKAAGFTFGLQNSGLGPAEIKWMKVLVDDVEIKLWDDLFDAAEYPFTGDQTAYIHRNQMVLPGKGTNLLTLRNNDERIMNKLWEKWDSGVQVSVCYCSVYEDCWLYNHSNANTKSVSFDICDSLPKVAFGRKHK